MACSVKKNRVLNTGCDLLKDVQNNIPILFYGIVLIDGDIFKVLGKTLYVICLYEIHKKCEIKAA